MNLSPQGNTKLPTLAAPPLRCSGERNATSAMEAPISGRLDTVADVGRIIGNHDPMPEAQRRDRRRRGEGGASAGKLLTCGMMQ